MLLQRVKTFPKNHCSILCCLSNLLLKNPECLGVFVLAAGQDRTAHFNADNGIGVARDRVEKLETDKPTNCYYPVRGKERNEDGLRHSFLSGCKTRPKEKQGLSERQTLDLSCNNMTEKQRRQQRDEEPQCNQPPGGDILTFLLGCGATRLPPAH